ncbi:MAG: helix-hairpin-helix domain-containing protein [Capsulimonadales bacterium]|nr:helix-hairpin-helix domain-containing protein [Capsulimonadales bacterium]
MKKEIAKSSDDRAFDGLSNREMAAILFNIATVLREEGNVNPWRTAAYERGARALMGYPTEATAVLAEQKNVPFRRWQHIGKRLQRKIREMATVGELAQYRELLGTLPTHRQELMTLPGIGPRTADHLHRVLGVSTAAELVAAARDGRLRSVRGFGPRRVALLAAVGPPDAASRHLFSDQEVEAAVAGPDGAAMVTTDSPGISTTSPA